MSAGSASGGDHLGAVAVIDAAIGPELAIVENGGTARAVIWPGMGAELRSMHRISLEPAGRTIRLSHPSEAVYYVISGAGTVEGAVGADDPQELIEGSMVHVDAGSEYALTAGSGGMELVGGPAPADTALYEFQAGG